MAIEEFVFEELKALSKRVEETDGMPDDLKDRCFKMLQRLERMAKLGHYATEFDTLSRYIEIVTTIPWKKKTVDTLDLKHTRELLDKTHYGMDYVKDRVLEYLATLVLLYKRGKDAIARSPIVLFVGLQGVGKTTMAMSMAKALDREFIRISGEFILSGRGSSSPFCFPCHSL